MIAYAVSVVYSVFLWRKGFRERNLVNYFLLLLAFVFHTTAMVKRGFSLQSCPVNNLYEATTFISWTIVAAYLVLGSWPKLRFLGAFASPVLLVMGVPSLDPPHSANPVFTNGWTSLHASLILLAFGSFGLGSVAALMYLSQEHDLKFRKMRAIFSLLPPIQGLERVTRDLLTAGFVLLTMGLSLHPLLPRDKPMGELRNDPILPWTACVWLLYLVLLVMRWRGQGGRRFAWGALGSFAFILLTFWGIILLSPSHHS